MPTQVEDNPVTSVLQPSKMILPRYIVAGKPLEYDDQSDIARLAFGRLVADTVSLLLTDYEEANRMLDASALLAYLSHPGHLRDRSICFSTLDGRPSRPFEQSYHVLYYCDP